MGSEDEKERGRIKRRNYIARDMLKNKLFKEKRIRDVSKEPPKFNRHTAMKDYYTNDEEINGNDCGCPDACRWPDCGCLGD